MALSELVSFLFGVQSFEIRKDLAEYKTDALVHKPSSLPLFAGDFQSNFREIWYRSFGTGRAFFSAGRPRTTGGPVPTGGPRATGGPAADGGVHSSAAECDAVRSSAKLICHLLLPVWVAARRGPAPRSPPARAVLPLSAAKNSGVSGFCPSGGWIYYPGRSY